MPSPQITASAGTILAPHDGARARRMPGRGLVVLLLAGLLLAVALLNGFPARLEFARLLMPTWAQMLPMPFPLPATTPPPRTLQSVALPPSACTPGSRYAFARNLVVAQDEWICGRATDVGGNLTVLGRVAGDVIAVSGSVTIGGEVDGSVSTLGGNISLLRGSHVAGTVRAWGGSVRVEPGARTGGGIQRANSLADLVPLRRPFFFPGYGAPWPSLLFWALAGAFIARFFPEPLIRVERVVRGRFGPSILTGAGAFIAGILFSILLLFTCLGIPLAFLLIVGLWVSWVVGTIALGLWLGQRLFQTVQPRERPQVLAPAIVGAILIASAEAIPIVGLLVGMVLGCAGLGAVLLTFVVHGRKGRLIG
ncbi:MAG: polymer-forming cytoskeletal protein [Ktedonobacterales bacterium]|nr:polymer-forming cytoskeletal protein [Ktedonobacterales bacterium]